MPNKRDKINNAILITGAKGKFFVNNKQSMTVETIISKSIMNIPKMILGSALMLVGILNKLIASLKILNRNPP